MTGPSRRRLRSELVKIDTATLRIAAIAIVAVMVAKLVVPRIPGVGPAVAPYL